MARSTIVYCMSVFGLSLLSQGCASTVQPEAAVPAATSTEEAEAAIRSVQMCTPGAEFNPDADYMVIKVAGYPDLVFKKVEYRCMDNEGIDFKEPKELQRVSAEACHEYGVPDARHVPPVLFMHEGKDNIDKLPVIYTRVSMGETISRIFANNPCLDDSESDGPVNKA